MLSTATSGSDKLLAIKISLLLLAVIVIELNLTSSITLFGMKLYVLLFPMAAFLTSVALRTTYLTQVLVGAGLGLAASSLTGYWVVALPAALALVFLLMALIRRFAVRTLNALILSVLFLLFLTFLYLYFYGFSLALDLLNGKAGGMFFFSLPNSLLNVGFNVSLFLVLLPFLKKLGILPHEMA